MITIKITGKRQSPEVRRRQFIAQAAGFFAEHGLEGGTRELARTLGVTQPLLYRYFPSKEELIQAVYQSVYLERWKPEWDALLQDRSFPIRMRMQQFYEAYTDAIFTREWMRIYLFSGLKGTGLNRWYVGIVEERILARVIREYRFEAGLPEANKSSEAELELAWLLQGGIFYYGVRKYIYELPVMENKSRMINNALDVFFEGISRVYGTKVAIPTDRGRSKRISRSALPRNGAD